MEKHFIKFKFFQMCLEISFCKKFHTVIFVRQERDCRFFAIRQARRQTEEALCNLVVLLQMTKGLKKLPLDFWGSELGDVCLSSIYFITLMDRHLSRKKDAQDYVYMPGNFKILWLLWLGSCFFNLKAFNKLFITSE